MFSAKAASSDDVGFVVVLYGVGRRRYSLALSGHVTRKCLHKPPSRRSRVDLTVKGERAEDRSLTRCVRG